MGTSRATRLTLFLSQLLVVAEATWIGFRHGSRSILRVVHLDVPWSNISISPSCSDKSLFAYHAEALVSSSPGGANASQTPQKLSGNKDVQFFTVGNLGGRTLAIYMGNNVLNCSVIITPSLFTLVCYLVPLSTRPKFSSSPQFFPSTEEYVIS
ncbi:hypothetical protein BDM02DRAFT_3124133 [Thelephora ganbajun]|uniref:Uncharacterized protein n=1 Tax=Thelephora ganbajun TaxID=370292 RepID=A0ACB6Z007_THEGA|nr:hypothetical protein BDM02DRAFT_3124133 [Thelephora ganbajun]